MVIHPSSYSYSTFSLYHCGYRCYCSCDQLSLLTIHPGSQSLVLCECCWGKIVKLTCVAWLTRNSLLCKLIRNMHGWSSFTLAKVVLLWWTVENVCLHSYRPAYNVSFKISPVDNNPIWFFFCFTFFIVGDKNDINNIIAKWYCCKIKTETTCKSGNWKIKISTDSPPLPPDPSVFNPIHADVLQSNCLGHFSNDLKLARIKIGKFFQGY